MCNIGKSKSSVMETSQAKLNGLKFGTLPSEVLLENAWGTCTFGLVVCTVILGSFGSPTVMILLSAKLFMDISCDSIHKSSAWDFWKFANLNFPK